MILLQNDAYFASGNLPSDYAFLRFMAKALGGQAYGLFGELL